MHTTVPFQVHVLGSNCVGKSHFITQLLRFPWFVHHRFPPPKSWERGVAQFVAHPAAIAFFLQLYRHREWLLAHRLLRCLHLLRPLSPISQAPQPRVQLIDEGFCKKFYEAVPFHLTQNRAEQLLARRLWMNRKILSLLRPHLDAVIVLTVSEAVYLHRADRRSFVMFGGGPESVLARFRVQQAIFQDFARQAQQAGIASFVLNYEEEADVAWLADQLQPDRWQHSLAPSKTPNSPLACFPAKSSGI